MRGLLNHAAVRRFIRDTSASQTWLPTLTRIPPAEIQKLQAEFERFLVDLIWKHPAHVKTFRTRQRQLRFGHDCPDVKGGVPCADC